MTLWTTVLLKRTLKTISSARKYPGRDLLTIMEAWTTLTWVHLTLRGKPFQMQARHFIEQSPPGQPFQPAQDPQIQRIRRLFQVALRHHPLKLNCMRITLALKAMLRRRAIAANAHIGVHKNDGILRAHAWLTVDGVVVSDHESRIKHYTAFDTREQP